MSRFPSIQQATPYDPVADAEFIEAARMHPSGLTTIFDRDKFQVRYDDKCVWLPVGTRISPSNRIFKRFGIAGKVIQSEHINGVRATFLTAALRLFSLAFEIKCDGVAIPLRYVDVTIQEALKDMRLGANISHIVLIGARGRKHKPPRPKKSIYPWVLDQSQIEARCQLSPLDVETHLLNNHIPHDIVKLILRQCDLGTLGLLGLTRRGVLSQSMSQATTLRLFDSRPDIKFARIALALFGFPVFEKKYRLMTARNLRQMLKMPPLATLTADRIPTRAIFAACKSIETIELVDISVEFDSRENGHLELAGLWNAFARLFPNVKSASSGYFGIEDMDELVSVCSWKNLTSLDCSSSGAAFADPSEDHRGYHEAETDEEKHSRRTLRQAKFWSALGTLTNLTYLHLPALPPSLSTLTKLKELKLSEVEREMSFEFLVPLRDLEVFQILQSSGWASNVCVRRFECISNLTNLRELSIQRSIVEDPDVTAQLVAAFKPLRKLEKVDLGACNNIERLPADLFASSSQTLRAVNVSECEALVDIEALVTLPLLRVLKLKEVQCSDEMVSSISRMTQLEYLLLAGFRDGSHQIERIAEGLSARGSLRNLKIKDRYFPDADLACVASLTSLRKLHVTSYSVTAAGFAALTKLTNLQVISMYCPKIRKAQIEAIFPTVEVTH